MMETLVALQRWIHGSVTDYLASFAATGDWAVLLSVVPLGIVFGAVHALTPGHSKTVLASYLVGARLAVLRGLAVSTVLAVTHVASAVVIALFASELLDRTMVGAGRASVVENLSRGLLIVIGVWLVYRALARRSHHTKQEGLAVGVVAGLIPCPLTLFVMVLAISRGVPEAGLAFALAMMVGIAVTLGLVAVLATVGRDAVSRLIERSGAPALAASRSLDLIGGLLVIGFAILEIT